MRSVLASMLISARASLRQYSSAATCRRVDSRRMYSSVAAYEKGDSQFANFNSLIGISKKNVELVTEEYNKMCVPEILTDRVLDMLRQQDGYHGGARVDLLQHGLQTATRALRDGADEEMVVISLLHDIGELQSPTNHGEIPAAILRPYISDKAWWILANHEVFQGFYYFEHIGGDPNKRDIYKEHPYYQATVDFCEKYDAPAFDTDYKPESVEFFRPMVLNIFSRKPYYNQPQHPKAVAVLG